MLYKCFVFTGKDLVAPLSPRQLQVSAQLRGRTVIKKL